MRVQQVGKVNFGHMIVADTGASKQGASIKALLYSEEGVPLGQFKGELRPGGFTKSSDYLDSITDRVVQLETSHRGQIAELEGDDKFLKGVVVFAPGPTKDNRAEIIGNLRTTAGESLTDINFNDLPDKLKAALRHEGILVADDATALGTSDMMGAAGGLSKRLVEQGLLENGFQAPFHYIGGGYGAGEIQVINGVAVYKSFERSRTNHSGTGKDIITAEKHAASAPAVISRYAEAVGYSPEDVVKLAKTGNAKIATQFPVIETNSDEADKLRATGLFHELEPNEFTPKVATRFEHEKACAASVEILTDEMARMFHHDAIDGASMSIYTGELTSGIGKDLVSNPNILKGKTLHQVLTEKTAALLDPVGTAMAKLNGHRIAEIPLKNATEGGPFVLLGKFSPGRGNWLEIPLDKLKAAVARQLRRV